MENILKEFEVLQKNLNDLPIENLSDNRKFSWL